MGDCVQQKSEMHKNPRFLAPDKLVSEHTTEGCIFCKIINGEIPSSKIYEDECCYAFLDINPIAKGHTLLLPKHHSSDFLEVSEEGLKQVMGSLQKVTKAVKEATKAEGIKIEIHLGKAAGQSVLHLHFHIIPRWEGDDLTHWPKKDIPEQEMKAIQDAIVTQLE